MTPIGWLPPMLMLVCVMEHRTDLGIRMGMDFRWLDIGRSKIE